MGCHPKTIARMLQNMREHPESADYWRDRLIDAATRATAWDADQWGFDPDTWCVEERDELDRRRLR